MNKLYANKRSICLSILFLVQIFDSFYVSLALPLCIQIGEIRSFIVHAPQNGETMSIKLPDQYRGLPIRAEYLPVDYAVNNHERFPCVLSSSLASTTQTTETTSKTSTSSDSDILSQAPEPRNNPKVMDEKTSSANMHNISKVQKSLSNPIETNQTTTNSV